MKLCLSVPEFLHAHRHMWWIKSIGFFFYIFITNVPKTSGANIIVLIMLEDSMSNTWSPGKSAEDMMKKIYHNHWQKWINIYDFTNIFQQEFMSHNQNFMNCIKSTYESRIQHNLLSQTANYAWTYATWCQHIQHPGGLTDRNSTVS